MQDVMGCAYRKMAGCGGNGFCNYADSDSLWLRKGTSALTFQVTLTRAL